MRCCVPGCKNDSRHLSKSHGITFHVFPVESSSRTLWLRAVGKDSWEPKERSTVCSDHFQSEDLYETKSGLRRVRSGAVPFVQEASLVDEEKEEVMKVCRICLATDTRLLSLKKHKLETAYINITGFALQGDEAPSVGLLACPWCLARLRSADELRTRSKRAHALLTTRAQMTIENVKEIDRIENHLTLNLSIRYFPPNHTDCSFGRSVESEEAIDCEQVAEVDIKEEEESGDVANEIFIDETQYNQDQEVKEECNENAIEDSNFAHSEGEYSTDDSLPLERRRTKTKENKEKKKKIKKKSKKSKRQKVEPKVDRRRKPFLNEDLNETLFTITDLTFDEQMAEILKRQESANYKNSAFKCTFCYKGFLDEDAYNGHIVKHTRQCGEYACAVCKTHFRQPHPLRKHITAHHTQRYSCNQCPYVTTHRQTARLHERWHKGTKYKCPHCQDEFLKFTTYMGHVRIKHPSHFICELCGNSFVSEKGIELHKKLKHRLDDAQIPPDGPYCETCQVRFVSVEAHLKHLQVSARHADTEKKPKESNNAEKRKRNENSKEKRESRQETRSYPSQVRKAEGPIACEQCGIELEDSRAYHGHFRRMHPDKNRTQYPSMRSPCMCEVCGRLFQSRALLRDHIWTHTGERPFSCGECGKSFRMRQRLVAHRRVHAAQKPRYACAACGKHFTTHSNRQRHMFIHTGLKPFACEMCGKCFKHASEKRAHVTYVHLKKPWPKRARAKRRGNAAVQPPDVAQAWPSQDGAQQMNDKTLYYDIKM